MTGLLSGMTYRQLLQPHLCVYSTFLLLKPLFTQPPSHSTPFYSTPLRLNPWYALCTLPSHHLCYPPTMSHSKLFSSFTPIITPTLHDHPRTNLVSARAVFAEWDAFGSSTPPPGPFRVRPDFPVPADLAANAGPAARDVFKRAKDSRSDFWLACSDAFCAAILESIGESNRLAISDPDTDTLHLSRDDCSPRGNDGCRGRRLASASEEKAFSTCRPPRQKVKQDGDNNVIREMDEANSFSIR
jgi:hypothetical protein